MAEFSSFNFLSANTNFDTDLYTYPKRADAVAHDEPANPLLESVGADIPPECQTPNQPCIMTFYTTHVNDNYRPGSSADNPHASTESVFDQDLKANSLPPAFSLNRFNFDAAHEFLIPRAVAYSAGLIDYFFRGKLEAEDVAFTDTGITLRVKNAIDPQKTPAWANETLYATNSQQQPSTLTIAYEYKDAAGETKYGVSSNTVPMAAEPGGASGIAPGQASQNVYSFTLSVPAGATGVKYRLVFRGRLGQEDNAVAVGEIEPVSGFVVTPNYIPADGIGGKRAIFRHGDQWTLDQRPDLIAGNVDWKGWYVNGRPAKVLSWKGPSTRYFPNPSLNQPWTLEVYQNGEYFAIAPGPVLGAALAKDTAGREWLLVICQDGIEDVVYRRPNERSETRDEWEEIGRTSAAQLNPEPGATFSQADIPWFFRGDGREAQTMRSWKSTQNSYSQLMRMKLAINADVTAAVPSSPANLAGFKSELSCTGGYDAYGAGSTNWNSQTAGEYIVAVDYRDDREVLAKVRVEAKEVGSTTASTTNGSTQIDESWREYLLWDGGQTTYYDEQNAISSSWTDRLQDLRESGKSSLYWRQFLYGLDLRNAAYAYTYWQSDQLYNISGTDQGYRKEQTDTITEGGRVDVAGQPPASIYSNTQGPFTQVRTAYDILVTGRLCSSLRTGGSYSNAWVAYGPMDFSAPGGSNGSFAVDTNGNIAASFDYLNFDNQWRHFHYLNDASLPQVLPGAPPDARYDPIGVIR